MSELKRTQQAIHEGFICSKCMRSFSGVPELLTHYEKCQQKPLGFEDGSKDSNPIKEFLGKAKQKFREPGRFLDSQLLNQQLLQHQGGSSQEKTSPTGPPVYFNTFQNVEVKGITRSLFDDFREIRSKRLERYASEANKLKIRLSKLVRGLEKFPNLFSKTSGVQDSVEWKAHEKSVVLWLDEKPVTRCPECTLSFNILRRKHHCRLCGAIICQDCSLFIPLCDAVDKFLVETTLNRESVATSSIAFRVCPYCSQLIKYNSTDVGSTESASQAKLLSSYDSLREKMEEINQLHPQLVTIVDSIRSGETLYSRNEATLLRSKLLRISEQIDIISKKIATLTGESLSNSQLKLQQRIRQGSVVFIRDFISKLPTVPDESQISETVSISSSCSTPRHMEILDDGWYVVAPGQGFGSSSQHSDASEEENPIQLQIRNVKFYIQQARAAGKMDEVEMLEASLADLLIWEQESRK